MKTKSKAEINKVIKANFGKMSYREIGKLVGLDSEAVRGRARRMGLTGSKNSLLKNRLRLTFLKLKAQENSKRLVKNTHISLKEMRNLKSSLMY